MSSFTSSLPRFRRLAGTTAVATLVLVAAGGLVRATGSGLGCLDEWPKCSGGWVAPLEYHAIIEYTHRLLAAVVAALVVATALRARKWAVDLTSVRKLATFGVVVVFVQAGLGALVVFQHLHATLVTLHFLTATLLVTTTTATYWLARPQRDVLPGRDRLRGMVIGAAVGTFLVLLVGTFVRERGAGLAFTDWPLMAGRLLPDLSVEARALQFAHRLLAALVLAHVVALALRARRLAPESTASRLTVALAAVFVAQAIAGAANVLSLLHPVAVLVHVVGGALTWAIVVALLGEVRSKTITQGDPMPEPAAVAEAR